MAKQERREMKGFTDHSPEGALRLRGIDSTNRGFEHYRKEEAVRASRGVLRHIKKYRSDGTHYIQDYIETIDEPGDNIAMVGNLLAFGGIWGGVWAAVTAGIGKLLSLATLEVVGSAVLTGGMWMGIAASGALGVASILGLVYYFKYYR